LDFVSILYPETGLLIIGKVHRLVTGVEKGVNPMAPFTIVVIILLTVLFLLLSALPLMNDSSGRKPSANTKKARMRNAD
jgi:hypothetical protein